MTKITTGRGAVSDGKDTNASEARTRKLTADAKTIIIYFSRSGNTEKQVRYAEKVLHADTYEIGVTHPYPANYFEAVNRATDERESTGWPELIEDIPDLTQYQTVLLAHPIWAMTLANPMHTFLEEYGNELAGKTIASFSTNAGYGSGDTQQVLSALTPNDTKILNNYTIEDTQAQSDRSTFSRWLSQFEG
jgi:flavodoxin